MSGSIPRIASTAAELNIEALRTATPGCRSVAFLNNAGASLPTEQTLEATISHLRREAVIGGYKAGDEAAGAIQGARSTAARLLGAQSHEIALTPSDTAGFAKVFWGMVNGGVLTTGARVVVDQVAYNSHYMGLLQLQRTHSITIDVLPSNPDGSIDVSKIEETLDRPIRQSQGRSNGKSNNKFNDKLSNGYPAGDEHRRWNALWTYQSHRGGGGSVQGTIDHSHGRCLPSNRPTSGQC
jgi:Aminotransferase class-V